MIIYGHVDEIYNPTIDIYLVYKSIYIVFEYSKLLLLLVTTGYLEVQIKLTTLLGDLSVVKHGWSTQRGPP